MRTLVTIFTALTVQTATAQSVVPLMNYQGRLANADGTPFPNADYDLRVSLYDAATNGTLVWGPQVFDGGPGAGHGPRLPVVQGYFNVMLGPVDTQSRSLLDAFGGSNRFIEVAVSNRPPIRPRQQMLPAPYAVHSANGAPPGTIVAYGGPVVPAGWLLCDGSALDKDNPIYERLWLAILTSWGSGSEAPSGARFPAVTSGAQQTDFNLPDLRGTFLRGVAGGRADQFGDSEAPSRTRALANGNSGNNVGSFQPGTIGDHTHGGSTGTGNGTLAAQIYVSGNNNVWFRRRTISTWVASPNYGANGTDVTWPSGDDTTEATVVVGQTAVNNPQTSESRPANAYVNYIIKY